MQRDVGNSVCRGTEVWYSLLRRGSKISLPLQIRAEGTLPVGGSRGLNLLFYPVGVLIEVFVCISFFTFLTIAWSRNIIRTDGIRH